MPSHARYPAGLAIVLLAGSSLFGCGVPDMSGASTSTSTHNTSDASTSPDEDTTTAEELRPIVIGEVDDEGALLEWQDGDEVEVVIGNQGFEMITFHVEVPIEPGDPDLEQWCVRSNFPAEDADHPLDGAGDFCHGLDAEILGERAHLGPVLRVLTSAQIRDVPLPMAVEVSCPSFVSVRTIELVLH